MFKVISTLQLDEPIREIFNSLFFHQLRFGFWEQNINVFFICCYALIKASFPSFFPLKNFYHFQFRKENPRKNIFKLRKK